MNRKIDILSYFHNTTAGWLIVVLMVMLVMVVVEVEAVVVIDIDALLWSSLPLLSSSEMFFICVIKKKF